jgi:hypothetical protein
MDKDHIEQLKKKIKKKFEEALEDQSDIPVSEKKVKDEEIRE